MIVLGIDTGATTAWGTVEDGRRVIAFGELRTGDEADHLAALLIAHRPDRVAIERVVRVHPVVRHGVAGISTDQALNLYNAGWLGGDLHRVALDRGIPVDTFPAEEWRKAMVGNAQADNATIERALRLRLTGFPAPRKSNNHERDAMGIAAYACLRSRLAGLTGARRWAARRSEQ